MKKFAVFLFLAAVLVGCAKPIYNVENHPVPVMAQSLPLDRIEAAIIQAGAVRNWKFQRAGSGHLVGVLTEPKYSATVDIYFDQHSYRIIKNTTTGLKEKDGTINRRYNSWVRRLETDIDTALANAGMMAAVR